MRETAFGDLRSFLDQLRRDGDLAVVEAEVDPRLEVAEVHRRVIAAGGPALPDFRGALEVLRNAAGQVETRFPLSWIKIRAEEIRLLRTTDEPSATELAHSVARKAEELGLHRQSRRIQALV